MSSAIRLTPRRAALSRQIVLFAVLTVLMLLTLAPFFVTLISSQKTNAEMTVSLWSMPAEIHPEYFTLAFGRLHEFIFNSILVAGCVVAGTIICSAPAAYAFARLRFSGSGPLFMLILALMMVPGILTLIPAFMWIREFPLAGGNDWQGFGGSGLLNTRSTLILPAVSGGQILGVLLFRASFESIPDSLFESARLDGATEPRCLVSIAIPLAMPVFATLAVLQFVGIYNDYIWPLLVIGDDRLQMFTVGVTGLFAAAGGRYGPTMAGYLIGSLPLLIVMILGMRHFVEGLTQGALKS